MKKTMLLLAAVATCFALSCQKEMEVAENECNDVFTLKASIEELSTPTKATINGSHQFLWSDGDQIGVYVNGWGANSNQSFTLTDGAGSRSGSFRRSSEDWFDTDQAQAAFFPWNSADYTTVNTETDNNVSGSSVYFKMKEGYDSYESGQMLTPLVAPMSYSGGYAPITFKHAGAAVKFVVSDLPKGAHSVGMEATGQQIHGGYHTDFNASANLTLDAAEDLEQNDVWLNFTPTNSERPFTFIFPVPALGENVKLTFKIYDKNDVLVWRRSVSSHAALNRGDILILNSDEAISIEPYRQLSAVSDDWTICGSFTSWTSDIEMMTDGESCIVKGLSLDADAEFKIRKGKGWGESYGSADLKNSSSYAEDSGGNVKIKATGDYDIVFNTSTHKIIVAPTGECPYPASAHHYSAIKNASELGTIETANCYVITDPGSYKIPVVKGNSSTSAGTVGGVELLWETYNNATSVTPNSVIAAVDWDERETGYIFFKTPDVLVPGNALIAAKDDSDNIIWSWHIWIPATEIQEVGSYDVAANYLMDRNLGALRVTVAGSSVIDVTSNGLFYQWGRKDPFVGPGKIDEGQYLDEGKISGTARTAGKVQISLEESIKQPTFFARGLYDGSTLVNPDWCSDQNGEYWGDSGSKSIYDPCPAGYRVPKRNSSKLLWADTMTGYDYSSDYYWFKVGDPAVVFPALGWIDGGTIKSTCRFGLWNSHHDTWGPDDPSDAKYGYNSYAAYARRFYLDSGVKLKNSSVNKSLGYNVRCESISNVVPLPPHHTSITGATNLGATKTANCYIITAAGSYKIPVVKGNSNVSAGTRASVQLLWETYNTTGEVTPNSVIAAVDYDDEDNFVYFKTPSTLKPGNALIAAKDAEGDIIWSWHIWIPSTEKTDITDASFYNRKVMDRNLGALEAVADAESTPALSTYGLYYQWGRKDPMFTSNWGRSASLNLSYQGYSGAGVSVTTEQSIKNPTTFYYDGSDDPKYSYWNSSDLTDLWSDSEKTIYDPCPAGYRVPKYDSNYAMWHYNVSDGWTSDAVNQWFKYGSIVFPYSGYASGSTLNYAGVRTVIWSSSYKDAERSYAGYIRSDKNPIYNYNSYYKAYLGSVRCVTEE